MANVSWWNSGYPFRRDLVIDPILDTFSAGEPISFTWLKSNTIGDNKIATDFSNLEVLYTPDLGLTWTLLGRKIDQTGTDFTVSFNAVTDISAVTADQYFVYFGNFFLIASPVRPSYEDVDWPISLPNNGKGVSYIRPGQDWQNGSTSIPNAQAAFTFYGTKVHVLSETNASSGIMRFQLDNSPAQNVSLFSQTQLNDQEVFIAQDLSASPHTLKIICTGGKSAPALGKQVNISKIEYRRYVQVTDLGEELLPTLAWSTAVIGGKP